MPFTVNSYAATSPESPLEPYKLERRDVVADDVHIEIMYSGMCACDLHSTEGSSQCSDGMSMASRGPGFPLVPGHQIVGVVHAVGPAVKSVKTGDIVAIGHAVDCGKPLVTRTYGSEDPSWPGHMTAGGYAEAIVVRENWVLRIPRALQDSASLPGVVPLLCAGITAYMPLKIDKVGARSKVAIVGLGAVGQMGVQIVHALGAEVWVISSTPAKRKLARKLGAQNFVALSRQKMIAWIINNFRYFDVVLDTLPSNHLEQENIRRPKQKAGAPAGNVYSLGLPRIFENSHHISAGLFSYYYRSRKQLRGSVTCGIGYTQDLLYFCAKHQITSRRTVISMRKACNVWERIILGTSVGQYVIDMRTLPRTANEDTPAVESWTLIEE